MQKKLRKVLFIDDDADILQMLQYSLDSVEGLTTLTANSAEEALKHIEQEHPDLIITDVMMPKVDGPSLLKLVRSMPGQSDVPIVFLTGKVQKSEVEAFLQMGVIDVFEKPFDPEALVGLIFSTWERSQKSE